MIAIVNRHPQRRRLNHPTAAASRTELKTRNRGPTTPPTGASCMYAGLFSAQTLSRGVPGHVNVVPARDAMQAPKMRNTPTAVIAREEAARSGTGEVMG